MEQLEVKNLEVSSKNKTLLKEVSFSLPQGQVHLLAGPNGSGKSTLINSLLGHPSYCVKSGSIMLGKDDLTSLDTAKRAQKGLFLVMQYPPAIEGVSLFSLLRKMAGDQSKDLVKFRQYLVEKAEKLGLDESFLDRYVHKGFSGGEKKRVEMLQLAVANPKFVLLDEPDSGLDVDGMRTITEFLVDLKKEKGFGMLLVTHYEKMLEYIVPDMVYVMRKGTIQESGCFELAQRVLKQGFLEGTKIK
jgi:Fe-S cluster assembly ATP-binding protein